MYEILRLCHFTLTMRYLIPVLLHRTCHLLPSLSTSEFLFRLCDVLEFVAVEAQRLPVKHSYPLDPLRLVLVCCVS